MKFIEFILANLLRFKYLGILTLAFLPIFLLDNKEFFLPGETNEPHNYLAQGVYFFAAVFCFLLFSIRFTSQISCIIVLSLFYNFMFLFYKNEPHTEFLFIAFFYLTIHLILLNRNKLRYVIPVLLAIVLMLKPIGIALLLAYMFHLVVFRLHSKKQKMMEAGAVLLIIAFTVFVVYLLLPGEISSYYWYMSGYAGLEQYHWDNFMTDFMINFKTYPAYILNFFEQDALPGFILGTIQVVCVLMFFVGLYFSLKNQFGFIDTVFFAYVICLLLLPGGTSIGFRQFIPIVPLFFYYMANSILSASNFLVLYVQHRFAIWFFLILAISNVFTIWYMHHGVWYHKTLHGSCA